MLTLCPNGNTCCSKPIETIFYKEMKELQTKHAFNKSSYIKQIKDGHSKIGKFVSYNKKMYNYTFLAAINPDL